MAFSFGKLTKFLYHDVRHSKKKLYVAILGYRSSKIPIRLTRHEQKTRAETIRSDL